MMMSIYLPLSHHLSICVADFDFEMMLSVMPVHIFPVFAEDRLAGGR